MTTTEYAILVFKSPPDFSGPIFRSLFEKLFAWQSECSGFPLRFHTNADAPLEVYVVTGWTSVAAHETWIRGERNQELLRVFGPYVDMPKIRMVHVDVDFETMLRGAGCTDDVIVVERYDVRNGGRHPTMERSGGCTWELIGRDLALDGWDVYRFVGVAGGEEVDPVGGSVAPVERWVLKRVEL